jgi:hypothetical protein
MRLLGAWWLIGRKILKWWPNPTSNTRSQKNTRRTPEEQQKNTRRTPEEHQKERQKNPEESRRRRTPAPPSTLTNVQAACDVDVDGT